MPLLLAGHIVLWTAYAIMAQSSGTVHHDMTEAYAWGREFQLGYYKHPPLFAWVVGLWFKIFPRTDAFYYLLSQINAAAGLAGVWMLAGRFLPPAGRLAAVLLLSLAPFNNIMAINFNANAMLVSLWPWTAFAFVRAIETGRAVHGAVFGALAALAMLSKYYSLLLLAGCFFASLAHPRARAIYRSPAPTVAVTICLLLLIPHIGWMASHDWQTIEYAAQKAGHAWPVVLYKTSTTAVASLALLGLPALVLARLHGRAIVALVRQALNRARQPPQGWITILALAPFVLTLLAGVLGSVKISTNFMVPVFFMVPLLFVLHAQTHLEATQVRSILWAAIGYPLAAIALSPAIAYVLFDRQVELAAEPRRELAQLVTQEWRKLTGLPLRIVTGSQAYGTGIVFYSPDSPHDFTRLNVAQAPWITLDRLRREGLAIACLESDSDCIARSKAILTPLSRQMRVSLARQFFGRTAPTLTFEVFLIPPGPIPADIVPIGHRRVRGH